MSAAGSIREARDGDVGAIVSLWTEAYVAEGEGGRTAPYVEADFAETVRRGKVLVAERDGTVIGVVALSAPGTPGQAVARGGEAELSRLVVVASARRAGIGRDLMVHCEQIARTARWSAIALWSRPYQVAAHRLYESLGYQRAPERDEVDESGHGRLIFRLAL